LRKEAKTTKHQAFISTLNGFAESVIRRVLAIRRLANGGPNDTDSIEHPYFIFRHDFLAKNLS
jgi:hypothetical protein